MEYGMSSLSDLNENATTTTIITKIAKTDYL
jgi:hypothetical protein